MHIFILSNSLKCTFPSFKVKVPMPDYEIDAVQKGRAIHEDVARDLLSRGLIEGEAPKYNISLRVAKKTRQLPSYTKSKGLDKDKLRQMVLQ